MGIWVLGIVWEGRCDSGCGDGGVDVKPDRLWDGGAALDGEISPDGSGHLQNARNHTQAFFASISSMYLVQVLYGHYMYFWLAKTRLPPS